MLYGGKAHAQTATHVCDPYVPGDELEVAGSFSHNAEDELLGLAWVLNLPDGWSVTNVVGDGSPEVDDDGSTILFVDYNLTNPVDFTITLDVPEGATGSKSLSATAQYWFGSMVDEAEIAATPDPLVILQDPEVTTWPEASSIIYGESLAESELTDGAAVADGSFDFADSSLTPPAGTNAFMVLFEPTDSSNYASVSNQVNVEVAKKALTLVDMVALDKDYDGTNTATITDYGTVEGNVGGDDVDVVGIVGETEAFFEDAQVGTNKTVTVGPFTLDGEDANNYSVGDQTTTADILGRELTVGGWFAAEDKLHDGNTAATIATNSLTLTNVVEGEESEVSLVPVAVFADSEIGNWTVSLHVSSELDGSGKDNYSLSLSGAPTTSAYILPFFEDTNEVPGRWYVDNELQPGAGQDWDEVPFNDDDEDRMLNWEEYVSGTDPKDDESSLYIADHSIAYGTNYTDRVYTYEFEGETFVATQRFYEVLGYTVEWPSVSGRWYRVDWTPNLETGTWDLLPGAVDLPANPPMNTYTDLTATSAVKFYRIRARTE